MIKLIACDMDGTLLNENGEIDKEFFHIYKRLQDLNIRFAVASGRQYHRLMHNFQNIAQDLIYIAENGTIVKYKNEEIYSSTLEKQDVMKIVEQSKDIRGINLILCGKNCAYLDTSEEEIVDEAKKYYHNLEIVKAFNEVQDEIIKIAVLDLQGSQDNSYKIFYPLWKDKLQVKVSGQIWMDLFSKDADKGIAMRIIQKKFNIDKKETMAFGDYFNDIEMFQEAYYSYAMENAPEEVKKHARFVAKSNRENGVVEKIKEVILNQYLE
ncbi:hypothetical protein SAMN05444401_2261 [Clostridium amylolyticum]|uniref:Uncharacterized protein n=1 Tax=Clostridium amylolyticum TaxID=1121298 RepID=A0A1M6GV98_9CLOT|nr:HAD family hydrolase [Clostridium amylolyticum]SHJ13902.1 hypothetical protein SAMN05444401_2261 [Clostridium amylolyticum]